VPANVKQRSHLQFNHTAYALNILCIAKCTAKCTAECNAKCTGPSSSTILQDGTIVHATRTTDDYVSGDQPATWLKWRAM